MLYGGLRSNGTAGKNSLENSVGESFEYTVGKNGKTADFGPWRGAVPRARKEEADD